MGSVFSLHGAASSGPRVVVMSRFCRMSIYRPSFANQRLHANHACCWSPVLQASRSYGLETTRDAPVQPFRKALKAEAREKRAQARQSNQPATLNSSERLSQHIIDRWELTVGIEIHAQLNTECKLFSHARSATTEREANSLAAVFDLALPGSQPIFQQPVLLPALRAAAALNCDVQAQSKFDRKHYFYHDQPAGYQITQYYEPFARNGSLTLYGHDGIAPEDGEAVTIGIKQIQLEQDTAKTVQQPPDTVLLDFNRVGHPLIEIIGLPHIHSPKTAAAYVRKVSQILLAVNAVTTGMELGGLRADVNVSVRPREGTPGPHSYSGVSGLGQRTEIKNLSSFKAVEDAIIAERNRQIILLEGGGQVEGETRGWTLGSTETVKLRGKEGEVDYRYMPDPDIPNLYIAEDLVQYISNSLPTLPDQQLHDLTSRCGISTKDAKTLIVLEDGARVDYFLTVLSSLTQQTQLEDNIAGRMAANWVIHELGGLLSTTEQGFNHSQVNTDQLTDILINLHRKTINGKTAKRLLSMVFDGDDRQISNIIQTEHLAQKQLGQEDYEQMAKALADENVTLADKFRQGQKGKLQWFIGQMMRQSRGTMDAENARRAVEKILIESQQTKGT